MDPAEDAGATIGCGFATLTTCRLDLSPLASGDQSCSCAVGGALGAERAIAVGVIGEACEAAGAGTAAGAAVGAVWRVAVDPINQPGPGNDDVGAGVTVLATARSAGFDTDSCVAVSRRCFSTDNR